MTEFPKLLRDWRKYRRFSQLDLALSAEISSRHLSFLETARSRPSREMIARLSDVLQVPLDGQNQMLIAAGFAPQYAATPLTDQAMQTVADAVGWTLDRHAPYPAIALDRLWTIKGMNNPAKHLFGMLDIHNGASLLDFVTSPTMAEVIENWPVVAFHTAARLRSESIAAGGIAPLDAAAAKLMESADNSIDVAGPMIPTIFRVGDSKLSLFATIAQFSTANDETLTDFKIELFFPADDASKEILHAMAVT